MEGYNIKVGVDSRTAERGVRSFSSALNESLKALRAFDDKARNAFKALDQFSKLNSSGLTRSVGSISSAVERLNRVKVSKALVNNLQTLQKTLSGIRFTGGDSLAKLPSALRALETIKVNPRLVSDLNNLKGAIKGFSSPPKSLAAWPKALAGFGKVQISPALAKQAENLKAALRGFTSPSQNVTRWAPFLNSLGSVRINAALPRQVVALREAFKGFNGVSRSAQAMPKFLSSISRITLNPSLATALGKLKAVSTAFPAISSRVGTNLTSLAQGLKSINPSDINRVAAALMKLNGLNINVGRSLSNMGNGRQFNSMQSSLNRLTASMKNLHHQTMVVHQAMGMLQSALGGLSLGAVLKSVYDTGASYMALQRTLGAVATSADEVKSHLQFINNLTEKMPVSLEAAHKAYSKFAVAARLSGMSVKDTQEIFEGFSVGFSAMGLGAETQKYAFLALEQMISKGAIQMEELRRQLGDHLPGAVQILADSMEVPASKLIKMIEAGEVTADKLLGMSARIRTQFAAAAEAAKNSSEGQMVGLQNAWVKFKRIVFGNDFNAALGAMANNMAKLLEGADMQKFAADVGKAFGRLFKAASTLATYLVQNKDSVITFMKAFAGYMAISSAATALRFMVAPLIMLGTLLGPVAKGFKLLGAGIALVASGQALKAIANLGKAFSGLTGKLMAVVGTAVLLAAAMDAVFNDGRAVKALSDGLGAAFGALSSEINRFGASMQGGFDNMFGDSNKQFDEVMDKIAGANLIFDQTMKDNAEREKKLHDDKMKALTDEEQKMWDKLNVIGKENEDYKKQLTLLDSLAKKRGMTDSQKADYKRTLDAQTLEDRNPLAGSAEDMRKEIANIAAKTAEQKAFNSAKEWEQELLKKGVVMTTDEWKKAKDAVKDYHMAIAKMNGEAGNGIERWVAKMGDWGDQMHNAVADGLGGATDELANFLSGAEADFAGLARSILKSFIKISLDGILKDMMTSMGMNPVKSGADQANEALSKLANLGETITTAQTNVYTTGLSINGEALGGGMMGDTALRGGLGIKGQENIGKTPSEIAKSMGLRGTFGAEGTTGGGHDFSKTQREVDRNPVLTQDALNFKFDQMNREGLRIEKGIDSSVVSSIGQSSAKMISLSEKEITDLKKTLMTEWVPAQGEMQGKGIIDTILNRKASGKWGNSVTDVVNADRQFSAINGREGWKIGKSRVEDYADSELLSGKGRLSSDLVDKYLKERAAGLPSSVGDHLNYANRAASDKKNLEWIDKLQGPKLGSHQHGTTADNQKYRPGEFGIQLPGDQAKGLARLAPGGLRMNGESRITPGQNGYDMVNGLNWDGRKMDDVKGLTLHHTGGRGTPGGVVDTLNKRGFGAQYIMDRDGKIFQTVPDGAQVSHMKNAQNGSGLTNRNALGMEMIAKNDQDLTPAQIESGKRWIEDMRKKYPGIGDNVYGHGELNSHKQATEGMGVVNAWRQDRSMMAQGQGIDPTVTGSIQQANNALKETGNALNQAMPGFQQLETKVQQTGTSAMTSGQQLQSAEQMKMAAQQQQVMAAQQSGVAMQSAGMASQMASPQFQQAGQAIAQAGQQAGQGAAAAQGGLGQLSSMLGMIPGMGQYGGLLSSFLGMFSEGGYSTSPVSKMRVPHYAEGTANTSGGIPAVLHPNEAVIPLSRGRKVPVEIDSTGQEGYKSEYGQARQGGPTTVNLNLYGVTSGDSFKKSQRQVQSAMAGAMQRNAQRDM